MNKFKHTIYLILFFISCSPQKKEITDPPKSEIELVLEKAKYPIQLYQTDYAFCSVDTLPAAHNIYFFADSIDSIHVQVNDSLFIIDSLKYRQVFDWLAISKDTDRVHFNILADKEAGFHRVDHTLGRMLRGECVVNYFYIPPNGYAMQPQDYVVRDDGIGCVLIRERNVFIIKMNFHKELLVENELCVKESIKERLKEYYLNPYGDPEFPSRAKFSADELKEKIKVLEERIELLISEGKETSYGLNWDKRQLNLKKKKLRVANTIGDYERIPRHAFIYFQADESVYTDSVTRRNTLIHDVFDVFIEIDKAVYEMRNAKVKEYFQTSYCELVDSSKTLEIECVEELIPDGLTLARGYAPPPPPPPAPIDEEE